MITRQAAENPGAVGPGHSAASRGTGPLLVRDMPVKATAGESANPPRLLAAFLLSADTARRLMYGNTDGGCRSG